MRGRVRIWAVATAIAALLLGAGVAAAAPGAPSPATSGVSSGLPVARARSRAHESAARAAPPLSTTPALIAAAEGRPVKVPEPTYRWRGLTVPVGACGAVVDGRLMVLPCGDKRVAAYRRRRAAERAAVWRWTGAAGAAALVAGGSTLALWRRQARRGV